MVVVVVVMIMMIITDFDVIFVITIFLFVGTGMYSHIQCESKKVTPPPKTFCDIFSCGELV